MAFTNFDTKEINCKIFYFGPRSAGKTANLRSIFHKTSPELRAGLFELEDAGPTQFFDFLPLSLGYVKDYHLKLHLYSMAANHLYETLTPVMLKGIDGFVYVNDSRIEAIADCINGYRETKRFLADEGHNLAELPHVIQYNKRDLPDLVPVDVLRAELNPGSAPEFEAVASAAVGTMETLRAMAKLVLDELAIKPR